MSKRIPANYRERILITTKVFPHHQTYNANILKGFLIYKVLSYWQDACEETKDNLQKYIELDLEPEDIYYILGYKPLRSAGDTFIIYGEDASTLHGRQRFLHENLQHIAGLLPLLTTIREDGIHTEYCFGAHFYQIESRIYDQVRDDYHNNQLEINTEQSSSFEEKSCSHENYETCECFLSS